MPKLIPTTTTPSTTSTDTIRQYLREIGRYALLTHEEEIQYGKQVQRMMPLVKLRTDLATQLDRSPTDAEWATAAELEIPELKAILRTGDRAKRKMVEANLRLVVSVAKKYQRLNLEMLDLLQEGGIGLQRAAEKFDPMKGYRFSTYSYWWIRQAMTRAISEQSRTVRLPVHMTEKLSKIKKTQRQLAVKLGRSSTIAEVAEALSMKPQQVRDCLLQARTPISLDLKVGSEQSTELVELLEDPGMTPDEYATLSGMRDNLAQWMQDLTPQQQQVLRLRYGLADNQPMTLQEISGVLQLTRERIRQIEQSAIKRLRKYPTGMTGFLAS
jgi:RNA polymerase nonessential primary-like sigma factor